MSFLFHHGVNHPPLQKLFLLFSFTGGILLRKNNCSSCCGSAVTDETSWCQPNPPHPPNLLTKRKKSCLQHEHKAYTNQWYHFSSAITLCNLHHKEMLKLKCPYLCSYYMEQLWLWLITLSLISAIGCAWLNSA